MTVDLHGLALDDEVVKKLQAVDIHVTGPAGTAYVYGRAGVFPKLPTGIVLKAAFRKR